MIVSNNGDRVHQHGPRGWTQLTCIEWYYIALSAAECLLGKLQRTTARRAVERDVVHSIMLEDCLLNGRIITTLSVGIRDGQRAATTYCGLTASEMQREPNAALCSAYTGLNDQRIVPIVE
jgi:hypothetical protein